MFTSLQKRFIVLSVVVFALALSGCDSPGPDLEVTKFEVGTLTADTVENFYTAPASITVTNIGSKSCGSGFSVAVYTVNDPDQRPETYFTVPGEFSKTAKWPTDDLVPNESVEWDGTIYVRGIDTAGANIAVWADANSVIDETNERNNEIMVPKDVPPWP